MTGVRSNASWHHLASAACRLLISKRGCDRCSPTSRRMGSTPSSPTSRFSTTERCARDLTFDRHMTILRFLWEHDPDELSTRVHQPVLVIAATGGSLGHADRVTEFSGRLRRGSVVWMDAHHDMHAQRPEEISELLRRFAAENPAGVT